VCFCQLPAAPLHSTVFSGEPKGHLSLPETRDETLASVHIVFGSSLVWLSVTQTMQAGRAWAPGQPVLKPGATVVVLGLTFLSQRAWNMSRYVHNPLTPFDVDKTHRPSGSTFVPLWLGLQTCREPCSRAQGALLPALPAPCNPHSRKHADRAGGGQTKAGGETGL